MIIRLDEVRHIKRVPKAAPEYDWIELANLRIEVGKLVRQWGGPSVNSLLGYTNADDITPEQIETLKRIAGPNGFIIYKMLCARALP